jgi:hypothetical protein
MGANAKEKALPERRSRQALLIELANIETSSPRLIKFLGRFMPVPTTDEIARVQAELRTLWGTTPIPTVVVQYWLSQAIQGRVPDSLLLSDDGGGMVSRYTRGDIALIPNWRTGQIEFPPKNFLGQLVTAVLENWRKFRVCINPNCPARFFFAKRTTSVVCERGDCSKYAQQQHALKWWRENRQKKGGSGK